MAHDRRQENMALSNLMVGMGFGCWQVVRGGELWHLSCWWGEEYGS